MDLHGLRQHTPPRTSIRPPWPGVNTRLSLLMFLTYAAPGAIVPLFSLRLKELGFTPVQIGWCCATQAIGSLLAPLLAGQIADRWLAAEKCLAICAFVAAVLLWALGTLSSPVAVFVVSLLFWLVMAPSLTLSTSTCFAHLRDPRREFGGVRMWGTVGWVVPGWVFGFWLASGLSTSTDLSDAFRLASILACVFGAYTLTLPHTPPRRSGASGAAPIAALRLLRGRAFFIYALCTLGVAVALPFSSQLSPLLLESLGVPRPWVPRLLTVAQGSEVISLLLLPRVLTWLGVRGTMKVGLAAVGMTLGGLAIGKPLPLVLAGLGLYGLCISCYLVAGQMYLNQRSREDLRASAQALHSVLCGVGLLIGNLLVGQIRHWVGGAFGPTLAVGAMLGFLLLVLFAVAFPRQEAS